MIILQNKEALLTAAKEEVDDLLSRIDIPITRLQWAAWLDDHILEFHERMKTASIRRRTGTHGCARATTYQCPL